MKIKYQLISKIFKGKLIKKSSKMIPFFIGIFIIGLFIGAMIPVNAITSQSDMVRESYDEQLLKPLSETDITNPIVQHLQERIPDIDYASVMKFYQDGLIGQVAWKNLLKGQDPAQFYCDYLSGADTLYNFSGGDKYTARQAYNEVAAVKNQINSLKTYEDRIAAMSYDDRLKFIHYEYRPDINLDKCFYGWDVYKVNYVLQRAALNLNTFEDQPSSEYDVAGWKHYAFLVNESMNNFTRDVGIYSDKFNRDFPNGGPDATEVKTSIILDNIYALNKSANEMNDRNYDYLMQNLRMKTAGMILIGAGTGMMLGSGTNAIMAKCSAMKAAQGTRITSVDNDRVVVDQPVGKPLKYDELPATIEQPADGLLVGDMKVNTHKFSLTDSERAAAIKVAGSDTYDSLGIGIPKEEVCAVAMRDGVFYFRNGESMSVSELFSLNPQGMSKIGDIFFPIGDGKYASMRAIISWSPTAGTKIVVTGTGIDGMPATYPISYSYIKAPLQAGTVYSEPNQFYVRCIHRYHAAPQALNYGTKPVSTAPESMLQLDINKGVRTESTELITFEEKINSMGDNETCINKRPTGELVSFDKDGLISALDDGTWKVTTEDGDEVPVGRHDLYNRTGEITTDAPFNWDVYSGTDFANFQDKHMTKKKQNEIVWGSMAGATAGGFVVSLVLPRILHSVVSKIPVVNWIYFLIGGIIAVVGAVLVGVSEILEQVISHIETAIATTLLVLSAQVKLYKFIYAPIP